jgi:hypothetical protein
MVFRTARRKLLLLLFVSLAFVAVGLWSVRDRKWMGLAPAIFFEGCALVFIRELLDTRPRIVIDDVGVFDRTLKVGIVSWDDILDAEGFSKGGQPFIALRLRSDPKYTDRLSPAYRRLVQLQHTVGFATLNLNLSTLRSNPYVLAEFISNEAERRRAKDRAIVDCRGSQ